MSELSKKLNDVAIALDAFTKSIGSAKPAEPSSSSGVVKGAQSETVSGSLIPENESDEDEEEEERKLREERKRAEDEAAQKMMDDIPKQLLFLTEFDLTDGTYPHGQ